MSAILKIQHLDIQGQPQATLASNYASAVTSITVNNTNGFTASKYLLIGGYNGANSEIKLGGAISSVAILATAATSFDHSAGESVQQIPYNQVEITYSADFLALWQSNLYETISDAATAASWATLSTVSITPNQEYTTVKDDSTSSRTYRWRFKNSTDTIYSDYINYQLPDGFEEKSIAAIFQKATGLTNKKVSSGGTGQVTHEFLFDTANEGLQEYHSERARWSKDQSFESVIGEMIAGTEYIVLPNNIDVRDTSSAIWNVRVDDGRNLTYLDKREMDLRKIGWHSSQLAVQLTSASTDATFDDTSSFPDSGTFTLYVAGTAMTVTYTANNRTTNVLTTPDCATEVTATAAVDTPVWSGASFGTPSYFTVYDGKIIFDIIPGATMHKHAVDADYYLKCQVVNSLDDYVRIANPNVLLNYIRWHISLKTNNDTKAAQYKADYLNGLKNLKRLETTGQRQYLKPIGWAQRRGRYGRYGMTNRSNLYW